MILGLRRRPSACARPIQRDVQPAAHELVLGSSLWVLAQVGTGALGTSSALVAELGGRGWVTGIASTVLVIVTGGLGRDLMRSVQSVRITVATVRSRPPALDTPTRRDSLVMPTTEANPCCELPAHLYTINVLLGSISDQETRWRLPRRPRVAASSLGQD